MTTLTWPSFRDPLHQPTSRTNIASGSKSGVSVRRRQIPSYETLDFGREQFPALSRRTPNPTPTRKLVSRIPWRHASGGRPKCAPPKSGSRPIVRQRPWIRARCSMAGGCRRDSSSSGVTEHMPCGNVNPSPDAVADRVGATLTTSVTSPAWAPAVTGRPCRYPPSQCPISPPAGPLRAIPSPLRGRSLSSPGPAHGRLRVAGFGGP